jgi:hypothetical protein
MHNIARLMFYILNGTDWRIPFVTTPAFRDQYNEALKSRFDSAHIRSGLNMLLANDRVALIQALSSSFRIGIGHSRKSRNGNHASSLSAEQDSPRSRQNDDVVSHRCCRACCDGQKIEPIARKLQRWLFFDAIQLAPVICGIYPRQFSQPISARRLFLVTMMQSTSHLPRHSCSSIRHTSDENVSVIFNFGADEMKSVSEFQSARELTIEELGLVSGGLGVNAGLGVGVTDLLGISATAATAVNVNVGGPLGNLLGGKGLVGGLLGGLLGGL